MRKLMKPALIAIALSSVSTLALAQSTTGTPTETPSTTAPAEQSDTMKAPSGAANTTTDTGSTVDAMPVADAEKWVGKRIYSLDGSDIGEVGSLKADGSGNVEYFRAEIGGFLGFGETHVQIQPAQFSMRDDKLYLNMTSEQAKSLPRAEKTESKQ